MTPSPWLILASQSPRRIELLKQILPDFEVLPSQVEEKIRSDLSPQDNALLLAREKALEVARRRPGHWVLGADTLVVLEDTLLGKPVDGSDARAILKRLSGRAHQVITGVALVNDSVLQEAAVSHVVLHPLTEKQIDDYINTGEPLDKAGAYAIQGKGRAVVASYSGSYSNIVGLPLETVRRLLEKAGISTA